VNDILITPDQEEAAAGTVQQLGSAAVRTIDDGDSIKVTLFPTPMKTPSTAATQNSGALRFRPSMNRGNIVSDDLPSFCQCARARGL
jgi:hypothetical protein